MSREFNSVSKPGLSNHFHVWGLNREADLGGLAPSERSWQPGEDSWKPVQDGVTPTAPWLRSPRAAWPSLRLEEKALDEGFLRPGNESHFIHPSICRRDPPPPPAPQEPRDYNSTFISPLNYLVKECPLFKRRRLWNEASLLSFRHARCISKAFEISKANPSSWCNLTEQRTSSHLLFHNTCLYKTNCTIWSMWS